MQSLAKTYLGFFEQLIRQKGRQLFQAGRTHVNKNEPGMIRGSSTDSGTRYTLGARVQGNELHVHCECPYFQERNGHCRHIWSFLLSIDQRGLSSYLIVDDQEGSTQDLVADEIWMDQKRDEPKSAEEGKSWKSLVNSVERIRKSQEKVYFKPNITYGLELQKDDNNRTELTLKVSIQAAELAPEEGNPFHNVPMERLLHVLKQRDLHIFNLILSNCATDPMGDERRFKLPISVEPKLVELLVGLQCTVHYGEVPQGHLEVAVDDPWEVILKIEDRGSYSLLVPLVVCDNEELTLDQIGHFIPSFPRGFYSGAKRYLLKDNVDNVWLQALEAGSYSYTIPVSGIRDFLTHFSKACSGLHPRVEWPENFWTNTEIDKAPLPILYIEFNELGISSELFFEYDMEPPQRISAFSAQTQVLQWTTRNSCARQFDEERKVLDLISSMKNITFIEEDHQYHIDLEHVQTVLRQLEDSNIVLFGKERKIKTYSKVQLELSAKVDWFEVKGQIEFGGEKVAVGDMLDAIRNNSRYILLGNGEYGLLPEQWIAKNKHLLELAESRNGNMKMEKNQFLLIKQMLDGEKENSIDIKKNKGLKELNSLIKQTEEFTGIKETPVPKKLKADLRNYQVSGLAWLRFLKKFHFGGILADDMGLGKTIQAISSLLDEASTAKVKKMNLIILPTSLIFNWNDEFRKFAPTLKIASYTGPDRGDIKDVNADVILTTYGILRRQADAFCAIDWNYVILDEAQAIKNHRSQTATAVCNLSATHRLSLTGTPIENNLMEMWSHMQFLNPSLLGSREQFTNNILRADEGKENGKHLQKLQKTVYPFILRRTKEDVLSDLPPKVEQIVQCSMGPRQQEYYNSIRDEFRQSLLDNITNKGMGSSKLKVIEGLLRLRQIACHPNLLDRNLSIPSTKLNHLISSLLEAIAENHKILVFSQFTSMLELIVRELTKESIRFTYLDGQTKDRQERVHSFQNDPKLSVFLISLKAGGTGLNLTAADYVFLYDPWWNPAAEQQAIDRTHRIGQTKKVFTYRLITKDTVEEKVIELQEQKKEMVKGVMSEDGEFVKKLNKNDIEYLFS